MTFAAGLMLWRYQGWPRPLAVVAWIAGAIFPTVMFIIYFSAYLSWNEAISAACQGWLTATTNLVGEKVQITFLGMDRPWMHLVEHASATLFALSIVLTIVAVAWLSERIVHTWFRFLLVGLLITVLIWLACCEIVWIEIGRCLLGTVLIYVIFCVSSLSGRTVYTENVRVQTTRLLMALLAVTLMTRMALNGRIYHYGYYQAALAALLVPAVLIGELPKRLFKTNSWGRAVIVIGTLVLLVPGLVILSATSQQMLRLKINAVGKGMDHFYTFPPNIEPTGEIVRVLSEELQKAPHDATLMVLPEGAMINYLARLSSPVAPVQFFGAATSDDREEQLIKKLHQHPPDFVVIVSRDLREYGILRYGEQSGSGQKLMRWVAENYHSVGSVGGDPLDYRQRGGIILEINPENRR